MHGVPSACAPGWVGWAIILAFCSADSTKLLCAQAELVRNCNDKKQSQPNPGVRACWTPCNRNSRMFFRNCHEKLKCEMPPIPFFISSRRCRGRSSRRASPCPTPLPRASSGARIRASSAAAGPSPATARSSSARRPARSAATSPSTSPARTWPWSNFREDARGCVIQCCSTVKSALMLRSFVQLKLNQ